MLAARKAYYECEAANPPEPPDKSVWTQVPHWRTTGDWPEPPYVSVKDRHLDEDGFQRYFGWEVTHIYLPKVHVRLTDPDPGFVGLGEKESDPDGFTTYLVWAILFPTIARDQFRSGYPRPHEIAADKGGKRYPPYVSEDASAKGQSSAGGRTPPQHKCVKRTNPEPNQNERVKGRTAPPGDRPRKSTTYHPKFPT